jgi:hypothetical protein
MSDQNEHSNSSAATDGCVVFAIEYEDKSKKLNTVGVSAESEYGAVKRLVGNRCCLIRRVEKTSRSPEWEERRIEGFIQHQFSSNKLWQYT